MHCGHVRRTRGRACSAIRVRGPRAGAGLRSCPVRSRPISRCGIQRLETRVTELGQEVEDLKNLVRQLQEQLAKANAGAPSPVPVASVPAANAPPSPPPTQLPSPSPSPSPAPQPAAGAAVLAYLPHGVTINALFDGYYEYNFNSPLGRVNTLRAYDVSSNSFSLNQADLIVESAPDLPADKRFGMRIDLQYGQATSTLQGNPANELRPDVYRNVFSGLRHLCFSGRPRPHRRFRQVGECSRNRGQLYPGPAQLLAFVLVRFPALLSHGPALKASGQRSIRGESVDRQRHNQTEEFNNYRDQLYGFVLTPTPAITWTLNYYQGQEHPDVIYLQSQPPGMPRLPNQQGTSILPLVNPPDGKLQIGDTYVSWQASKALLFAAEADYVQERLFSYSSPQRTLGGALYAGYQITPKVAFAARAEYAHTRLPCHERLLVRGEFRRDQSNQRYFLSSTLGLLETAQPTLGLGLVWWLGQKEGPW